MAKPQLLYGAYDTGPSHYGLDVISYAQRKLNWSIKYVGNTPTYADVYGLLFDYAIVGGPSSFAHDLDAMILTAAKIKKKPVYVLGDTPRSILRPDIQKYIDHATAIVAVPFDIPLAKKFGYHDAVWLGYPSHWGNPATTKPSKIFTHGEYAKERRSARIFVCGLKDAKITDTMLQCVRDAMTQHKARYYIYFQAHPSEIPETQDAVRRKELLRDPIIEITTRESVPSIMMAADITVCTGGAIAVLEGALLRLPVIYYLDSMVMEHMKKQVNEEIWGPVSAGACIKAFPDMMSFELSRLLNKDVIGMSAREHLRFTQDAAFPEQPSGMDTIAEILAYVHDPVGYIPFHERKKQ